MSLELKIYESEVTIPRAIENIVQLKEELTPKLEYYNNLVVTEDGIKAAKTDKSNLNKLRKAIEERRIEAKKQVLSLYEPLETQCKELSALIEQPITAIDCKIKEFESAESEKKWLELNLFFGSIKPPEWLTLDDVVNPKWKNKTMTLDKLKQEISTAVCTMQDEYTELQTLYGESPMWTAINQRFMECKNKSQTLIYAAQLERQHSDEQKRAEAIQKAREEQECANALQNAHTEGVLNGGMLTPENEQNAGNSASVASEPILRGKFEVECEKDKLIALVQYMKANGIKYSVVKE
jgi:hypothetical protein